MAGACYKEAMFRQSLSFSEYIVAASNCQTAAATNENIRCARESTTDPQAHAVLDQARAAVGVDDKHTLLKPLV